MPTTLYLDSNATTFVLPEALDAATRTMALQFGNPSSNHSCGLVAKDLLEQTRSAAREVLGAVDGDIVFNSGATEGIQTAILSALCAVRQSKAGHLLVYGATEHKAVPQALAHWNAVLGLGLELRALPVDAEGRHDLRQLAAWLPETALLCTMAANNETGVVSDLAGIEQLLAQRGTQTLWLVDGVQALGKLALNLQTTRIDYAVFSGHKLYAPKGVGMLYVRKGAPFTPLMVGGGQEDGRRGGTENMPGIAALGAVLRALLRGDTFATTDSLRACRDRLEQTLRDALPSIVFNAPLADSLPTTLNFSVPGVSGKTLLDMFDAAGLSLSAGSACSAAKAAPSHVLSAMGWGEARSASAVRLSIGALTTAKQVEQACAAIARCAAALPSVQPMNTVPALPGTAPTLLWCELREFLAGHPQAQLVDLREACEQQVAVLPQSNCPAVSAPMSQLPTLVPQWLQEAPARPRVLVCRSGKRSQQAVLWLQSLGLSQVWHLHGGLALRPQHP